MAYSQTRELMQRYPSPVPKMTEDGLELQNLYTSVLRIVPPYLDGTAMGFQFLKFLRQLAINSPSHGSCINSKLDYSFGNVVLEKSTGMGYYKTRQILPDGVDGGRLSQSLYDMGATPKVVVEVSRGIERCLEECGNAYVRVRLSIIGGVTKVSFQVLNYARCAYMQELSPEGNPIMCVSPVDFDQLMTMGYQYKPEFIAASTVDNFKWSKSGRGGWETVLHVRQETERSPWYGETKYIAAILYAFAEWQLADYTNREAANDWLPRVLMFFQDETPTDFGNRDVEEVKEGFRQLERGIKNAVLKSSQSAEGVAAFMYPNGEEPPTVVKLEPMTNQDYFNTMKDVNAAFIYGVHNWSKVLTGFEAPAAGIGGNSFLDEFEQKDVAVIKPIQRHASMVWDGIFEAVAQMGGTDLTQYGIGFQSPFAALLEQRKQLQTAPNGITE